MSKLIILAIFLIAIVTVVQSAPGPLNYLRPRHEISCNSTRDFGWYWDGQKCEVCKPNCQCDSYKGCNRCYDGYTKTNIGCYFCGFVGRGIQSCCLEQNIIKPEALRATACYELKGQDPITTYKLFGHICYNIEGCTSYSEFGRCLSCHETYYQDEFGKCISCKANNGVSAACVKCGGPDVCAKCQFGYYIPKYTGSSNIAMDKAKISKTEITQLSASASMCLQCNENCICSDQDNKCTGCLQGVVGRFYDTTAKTCALCTVLNCASCPGDGKTCNNCVEGWIKVGNECKVCPANCNICVSENNNAICIDNGCDNGFYRNNEKKCSPCGDKIWRCQASNATGQLIPYPTQCTQDIVNAGETANETTHYARIPFTNSYYLWGNASATLKECIQNIYSCKNMLTNNDKDKALCDTCYIDHGWVKTSSNKCKHCRTEIQNCIRCEAVVGGNDDIKCLECDSNQQRLTWDNKINSPLNYFVSGQVCADCQVGCLSCTQKANCTTCQDSYRKADTGNCEFCELTYCRKCEQGKQSCERCYPGFRLWTNAETDSTKKQIGCEKCPNACASCQGNRNICEECMGGFFLNNGICKSYRIGCLVSNNDGTCTTCNYGFRLIRGYCLRCVTQMGGYINCQSGCSIDYYVRDGDVLSKKFNDNVSSKSTNSSYLSFALTCLLALIALLI